MLLLTTITVYIVNADVEPNALMVRKERRSEIKFSNMKELLQEVGNIAQWSRVNAVLSEERFSVCRTHGRSLTESSISSSSDSDTLFCPEQITTPVCTYHPCVYVCTKIHVHE